MNDEYVSNYHLSVSDYFYINCELERPLLCELCYTDFWLYFFRAVYYILFSGAFAMTYHTLTDQEKERIFAEDVLGWTFDEAPSGHLSGWDTDEGDWYDEGEFHPLEKECLHQAMFGVEKLIEEERAIIQLWHDHSEKWHCIINSTKKRMEHYQTKADTPNAAIVEACMRIKRPDLFEGE